MQDGKHVILCVDDDPDCLEVLRTVLEANGYVFAGAASAEEALKLYQQGEPDLLIVDLMMEEVDSGASLVKEIRFLGCQAPVYMLSSVGDMLNLNIDTSDSARAGVFQKPIEPKTLVATLDARLK